MKHPLRAAALAAGALLCFSASQAFADLEFVEAEDGGSWHASYRLVTNATHTYDTIVITIDHNLPMTFFKNATWYSRGVGTQDSDTDGYEDGTYSDFNNTTAAFLENGSTRDFFKPGNTSNVATLWNQTGANTFSQATASGDVSSDLRFWLHLGTGGFGLPQTRLDGVRFTLDAYRGGVTGIHVASGQAYYREHINTTTGARVVDELSSLTLMPVPAALWTGLPMLGGVILLIRRNNKRRVLS